MDTVIFGLSLTTWLVILGVFAIVTPIVGKQVAKDSLRIKDSLLDNRMLTLFLFPLEYLERNEKIESKYPVQKFKTMHYIKRMMLVDGIATLLMNFLFLIFFSLYSIIGLFVYSIGAFFRGIFSAK